MDTDDDEFQLDLHDLVGTLPVKKNTPRRSPPRAATRTPHLGPPSQVGLLDELFQVTRKLRMMDKALSMLIMPRKTLRNDKVERLMQKMGLSNPDYSLDADTRGRYYARDGNDFLNTSRMTLGVDSQLDEFLDKENIVPEPVKKRGMSKPGLRQTRSLNTILTSVDLNGTRKRNLDVLRSLLPVSENSVELLPKRRCVPPPPQTRPKKLALNTRRKFNILLVESLLGNVLEATTFATELNLLRGEMQFEIPYNPSEVVQIPTSDPEFDRMAIIRMAEEPKGVKPTTVTIPRHKRVKWKEELTD